MNVERRWSPLEDRKSLLFYDYFVSLLNYMGNASVHTVLLYYSLNFFVLLSYLNM